MSTFASRIQSSSSKFTEYLPRSDRTDLLIFNMWSCPSCRVSILKSPFSCLPSLYHTGFTLDLLILHSRTRGSPSLTMVSLRDWRTLIGSENDGLKIENRNGYTKKCIKAITSMQHVVVLRPRSNFHSTYVVFLFLKITIFSKIMFNFWLNIIFKQDRILTLLKMHFQLDSNISILHKTKFSTKNATFILLKYDF